MKHEEKQGKVALNQQLKLEALLSAAYDLFITKGIEDTTINEITEQAGIGKGTLYIYFDNKYEIAREIVNRQIRQFLSEFFSQINRSLSTEFKKALQHLSDYLVDYIADDPMKRKFIMNYIGHQFARPEIIIPEQVQELLNISSAYDSQTANNMLEAVLSSTCFFACTLLDRGLDTGAIKQRIRRISAALIEEF